MILQAVFGRPSSRVVLTRSCITSAAPGTSSSTCSACSTRGGSTATTATPTSARRARAPATRSGTAWTGPRRITPTRASSCCSPRTSRPVTTSTPTRSGSSRPRCAAGNLGGWQVARALELLVVLMGAVSTPGGTAPSAWHKAIPAPPMMPPPSKVWSELLMPREYPLAFFEMSFLLPHFLREGRGKLAMYFTRVYNPVWTNPDGMSWIEMLTDEAKIERHVCLSPVWSETAWFADYVLPMGHASERHDLMSQETHAARWIGFRQPVLRVALEKRGQTFDLTWQAHEAAGLGQIWEEDEFWIELSWRIDPDGSLGIRKYFESPYRPGSKVRIEEIYRWIFENSVPGLPEAAKKDGLTPLAYMRKYGAFLVEDNVYRTYESPQDNGVVVDGVARVGFPTPSRKLEFFSKTLKDWKWPEHAVPGYIRSHVHWSHVDRAKGEMVLLPTFRLPTLIHTRP